MKKECHVKVNMACNEMVNIRKSNQVLFWLCATTSIAIEPYFHFWRSSKQNGIPGIVGKLPLISFQNFWNVICQVRLHLNAAFTSNWDHTHGLNPVLTAVTSFVCTHVTSQMGPYRRLCVTDGRLLVWWQCINGVWHSHLGNVGDTYPVQMSH